MEYQDRQITCLDCSQPFLFSAGEQEFYARKGFREEPKRCKPCRETRKARRDGGAPLPGRNGTRAWTNGNGAEVDDDVGNRVAASGGERGPRVPREVRGGRSGQKEMFEAVCASCGGQARVPFRPVAARPVYCRDCYSSQSPSR
jgi:CxxC-x17-CxxC domain-containing protein